MTNFSSNTVAALNRFKCACNYNQINDTLYSGRARKDHATPYRAIELDVLCMELRLATLEVLPIHDLKFDSEEGGVVMSQGYLNIFFMSEQAFLLVCSCRCCRSCCYLIYFL